MPFSQTDKLASARQILQQAFGLPNFRSHQIPIIEAAIAGKDVLAVLSTGGGKSICFQVPALLKTGLTLVITPLISLMKDQVDTLVRKSVAAAAWHSQLSQTEEANLISQLKKTQLRLLYLSPEKLAAQKIQNLLANIKIDLLVIDEAHCISLWGHDFRPSYLKIKDWLASRELRPQIMALTATATADVRAEICQSLGLENPTILATTSVRNNLSLSVYPRQTPMQKYISVLTLLATQPTGTIMIYCATRGEVEFLAANLKKWHLPDEKRRILAYHGGLPAQTRQHIQSEFTCHTEVIMVATNAFGMGIDKSNIRLIIHVQLPSNLENYAQEIGRAGRDGQAAKAVLLASDVDWELQIEMAKNQPNHDFKMAWLKQFILSKTCRQQTMAEYFGEKAEQCQQCDICVKSPEQLEKLWPSETTWRVYQKLKQLKIPYLVTLKMIALLRPQTLEALQKIPGIGAGWIQRWGLHVLKIIAAERQMQSLPM